LWPDKQIEWKKQQPVASEVERIERTLTGCQAGRSATLPGEKMTDKERKKSALIGLSLGFIVGCGLNYLILLGQNWLSTWTAIEPVKITFWNILPLGILMGLSMAAVMMTGYLGD